MKILFEKRKKNMTTVWYYYYYCNSRSLCVCEKKVKFIKMSSVAFYNLKYFKGMTTTLWPIVTYILNIKM